MSNSPTRRLMPEDAKLQDPRERAKIASHLFVVLYVSGLVVLVTVQFLAASSTDIPVLQRLLPSTRFGLWEIPMGVGVGALVVGVQLALRPHLQWLRTFDELMFGMIGKPTVMQCLGVAFSSALAEEVLFRGMIQASTHLVVACILFGLAHYLMWQWAVFALVLGVVLGGMFELTGGGLLAPFLAHFTINALGLLQISRECPDDAPPYMPDAVPEKPEGQEVPEKPEVPEVPEVEGS